MIALRLVLIPLLLWLTALPALAQSDPVIITWNTGGGEHPGTLDAAATPTGVGITQSPMRREVVVYQQTNNAYNSNSWTVGATVDLTRYVEWGFNTSTPYLLNHLRIRLRRSNAGPTSFRIDMQVDGGAFSTVLASILTTTNLTDFDQLLGDAVVNSSVRFRLYGWNAASSGGTLRVQGQGNASNLPNRGISIRGRPALAELEAEKDLIVFSEDGTGCGDLTASPPTEPENPAAIPGACIQYTISVANTGSVAAENITLVDALPAHLTFVGAALSPTTWGTLATPDCPGSGCEVRINDGVIAANQTATVTIRATIN